VIGKLSIDILDASGTVVDTIPAGKRKGLNRVEWAMRTKPPHVPPAASLAGNSTEGPRVLPGTYTVRLTRSGQVSTMPLTVGLDRRATYTVADRTAQFEAANRVKALFARMTTLVAGIASLREQSSAASDKLGSGDPLRAKLAAFSDTADSLRKRVVATTEGGAITGEMRLREDTDDVYGAVMATEGAPTTYALARIDVLDRELADVEKQFATLTTSDLPTLNDALKAKSLSPLSASVAVAPDGVDGARGGPVEALFANTLGTRFYGTARTTSTSTAEREKD